jgi:hypothetical protein
LFLLLVLFKLLAADARLVEVFEVEIFFLLVALLAGLAKVAFEGFVDLLFNRSDRLEAVL